MNRRHRYFPLLLLTLSLLTGSLAQASDVLLVNISGIYNQAGNDLHTTLIDAGATTTFVNLSTPGQVVTALQEGSFDQVWVFDLSNYSDNYPDDFAAIADWYLSQSSPELICDGRIISSYWYGRWATQGMALTSNYYQNLDMRGGGLVLGTDHSNFHYGINDINDAIGIDRFHGNFNLNVIPVDTANPLMNTPNDLGATLSDDSSPGQTPYGLQPNGQILYTVAWHSNNPDTPGISSTIEGEIGMHVSITTPPDSSSFDPDALVDFSAQVTGGTGPFTYQWSFNSGTPLGSGQSIQVPASAFPTGPVVVTVMAQDSENRSDDDSVLLTINPANTAPECHAGGPYYGNAGELIQFDGSNSVDHDGNIVSWEWNFGDGNSGTGMNPTHTYAQDGDYQVTLCVTDDDGQTSCCATSEPTIRTQTTQWGSLKASYR